jgi:hypothetical protein
MVVVILASAAGATKIVRSVHELTDTAQPHPVWRILFVIRTARNQAEQAEQALSSVLQLSRRRLNTRVRTAIATMLHGYTVISALPVDALLDIITAKTKADAALTIETHLFAGERGPG